MFLKSLNVLCRDLKYINLKTIFGQNPLPDLIRDSAKYLDPDPFETLDVPFLILLFLVWSHQKKVCCIGSFLNPDVEIR